MNRRTFHLVERLLPAAPFKGGECVDQLLLVRYFASGRLDVNAFASASWSRRIVDDDGCPVAGGDVLRVAHVGGGNPVAAVGVIESGVDGCVPGYAVCIDGCQRDVDNLRENGLGGRVLLVRGRPR